MKLIQTIRKILSKPQASRSYEYVRVVEAPPGGTRSDLGPPPAMGTELRTPVAERAEEIAFSHQGDLESYVRGLDVPKEAIERWLSAGVLLPEETRVASQMIRIICKNK
jgi:hypothetical protein